MNYEQILMAKIFILDEVPKFFITDLERLGFEVGYHPGADENHWPSDLREAFGIVVRSKTPVTESLLDQMPDLKLILRPGSGIENIDQQKAVEKGITIINSPEGNRDAVGEHVIGMLLALMHNIVPAYNAIKNHRWERTENRGIELKGKTIGIVGYGNTGSRVAKKLQGFEMEVLAYDLKPWGFGDEYVQEANLATLQQKADILTFHIPLSDHNYHFINEDFLNKFEKPVVLMNASRGKILDTNALLKAIRQEQVIGACLDVLENEVLSSYNETESVQLSELLNNKNVLITPHIGGWSQESLHRNYSVLIRKLQERWSELIE